MHELVANCLIDYMAVELAQELRAAGVPTARVNDTLSVLEDSAGPRVGHAHVDPAPDAGPIETLGFPVKYDNIEPTIDRHPPLLGEHTGGILRSAGYDRQAIDELLAADVVAELRLTATSTRQLKAVSGHCGV